MNNIFYSIGRDESCDIVLYDHTNEVSREHAFLKEYKGGHYTICDRSKNGTYVNGIRIESGVEVPVTREDIVSFAHVVDLDWTQIPDNAGKRRRKIIWFSVGGALLLAALCWLVLTLAGPKGSAIFKGIGPKKGGKPQIEAPVAKDTVSTAPKVEVPVKKVVLTPKKKKPAKAVSSKPEPAPVQEKKDSTANVVTKKVDAIY